MTTVSVANSNNRLTDCDATTGFVSDGGGGAGPQNEPDFGYQLTSGSNYGVSRKVGATKGGHIYTHGSTVDMTAEANQVWIAKGVWTNSINTAAYPACGLKAGNSSTVYYEYGVFSSDQIDQAPDPKQLARIIPIDPNVGAWPDIISGTPPTISTIDAFGIQGDFGGSAKAENVVMDAIDIARGNGALWLTGGTSTDPRGTFDDFVVHDETALATRIGHISTVRPGVFEVFGKLWTGRTETPTATATGFEDSGKALIFGAGFFDTGWTGLGVDLGADGDDYAISDMTLIGQGQSGHKVYFDTITEIDPTPDEVTLDPAPGFITGTPVVYSNEGGSDTIGLTNGNTYWLEEVTATTFNVHSTRNGARTAGTPIALSDGSSGEAHSLTRTPDIRPDFDIVGNTDSATITRCSFFSWRNFLLTTSSVFQSCVFNGCELIDMTTNNGGSLQDCIFSGQTTEPGVALVQTNTTVNIDNCTFILTGDEVGHAIEIDTAGTYALAGNTLTGYWTSPDNDKGAEFHTQTGVDDVGEDITTDGLHGFATGDEVYYNDNGGSDTIGLTDGNRYYVNVISTTNFSLHQSKENATSDSNRIGLTDGTTGETHTFYSGKAAVVNTSGGLVTFNVSGGTAPSIRNVGAATAVVNAGVTFTVTGLETGSEVRIFRTSDDVELAGVESSSTSFNYVYTYVSDTPVRVIIMKFGFQWKQINVTLGDTDASQKAGQLVDFADDNPA